MASNKISRASTTTCKPFGRTKRANIQVPISDMFWQYNTNMGGMDLLDNLVACYR